MVVVAVINGGCRGVGNRDCNGGCGGGGGGVSVDFSISYTGVAVVVVVMGEIMAATLSSFAFSYRGL